MQVKDVKKAQRLSIIPGLGQLYNGQTIKGVGFIIILLAFIAEFIFGGFSAFANLVTLGSVSMEDNSLFMMIYGTLQILLTIVFIVFYIANLYDAKHVAQLINNGKKVSHTFKELGASLVDGGFAYLLTTPAYILMVFTIVFPVLVTLLMAFTNYDFAHLLFSDGTVKNTISLDNQLNIIQVADLVLPDKDTTFEEYTTIELLSVSMLIVISTFALDFIHSDRSIFKIVDLDEAWAFLNVAQGETLSNKLVRAGRAMQAGVYFVTQSSGDVAKESLKNNIGLKFAFRSTDINEIKQTLEFFGIDKDDENNQKRLRDLENGQCLLQDLYGRVGVVQIHPVFEELLHAFDTRPPVQRNEVE